MEPELVRPDDVVSRSLDIDTILLVGTRKDVIDESVPSTSSGIEHDTVLEIGTDIVIEKSVQSI